MSHLICPECNLEVDAQSSSCIHCGYPMPDDSPQKSNTPKNENRLGCGSLLLILIFLLFIQSRQMDQEAKQPKSTPTKLQKWKARKSDSKSKQKSKNSKKEMFGPVQVPKPKVNN